MRDVSTCSSVPLQVITINEKLQSKHHVGEELTSSQSIANGNREAYTAVIYATLLVSGLSLLLLGGIGVAMFTLADLKKRQRQRTQANVSVEDEDDDDDSLYKIAMDLRRETRDNPSFDIVQI